MITYGLFKYQKSQGMKPTFYWTLRRKNENKHYLRNDGHKYEESFILKVNTSSNKVDII
jgi:hypothetical protein